MAANASTEQTVARYILETEFSNIPAEAVAATKQHILHTVGTVLAGSAAPGAVELVETLRQFGGTQESSIFGWNLRVPAAHAAMANSMMGHAQDFDNNDDRIAYKTSVCAVPAALAVAESLGTSSGRDLVLATCIGIDLGIRMGLAVKPYPSHSQSPELGPFAAAAAAAKLMKLNEDQVWDALGIAMCGVATVGVSTAGLSYSKRFEAGAAARNGVFAALLASKGFRARQNIFVGPGNFFKSVWKTEADLDIFLANLGERFEVVNVGPKPYPCCRYTHAPVDAALSLMSEHKVRSNEIEQIRVTIGPRDFEVVFGGKDGVATKQKPRTIVDAQFSIPYTVATAILKGGVFLDDFTEDAIKRPDILEMSARIVPIVSNDLDKWPADVKPCEVQFITTERAQFSRRIDYAKGNPRNPVPYEEMRANFLACAERAHGHVCAADAIRARGMIENLESLASTADLSALVSGTAAARSEEVLT
jgi:2-methylcitrate dehydratase PrpD